MGEVSERERKATIGKDASNSVSESLHALTKDMQQKCGPKARTDRLAAVGQSIYNNDFGHATPLVTGRKPKAGNEVSCELGEFYKLRPELQASLVQAAKETSSKWKKKYDLALVRQQEYTRRKREIMMEKKLKDAEEHYIVALYFYEQYDSPRCWTTVRIANDYYCQLNSESARLAAVKEQILIRYLGLGWTKAHHPWSSKDHGTYNAKYLLKWLTNTVIPLADVNDKPDEPPLRMPTPPQRRALGTTSALANEFKAGNSDQREQVREGGNMEREKRMSEGRGDKFEGMQLSIMPKIDKSLKGFHIEMLFEYPNEIEGGTYLNWTHGVVDEVIILKTVKKIKVTWAAECLGHLNKQTTIEKLMVSKWNPKKAKAGSWRQYLG